MFSWYRYLIFSLVFSHLGFWSGNLFLIAPFPDLCLHVPFHRLTMGKSKKIFCSEITRPRASLFCMQQCLVVHIINCANHDTGVKFGHAPGVDSLKKKFKHQYLQRQLGILIKLHTQHHWAVGKFAYCFLGRSDCRSGCHGIFFCSGFQ